MDLLNPNTTGTVGASRVSATEAENTFRRQSQGQQTPDTGELDHKAECRFEDCSIEEKINRLAAAYHALSDHNNHLQRQIHHLQGVASGHQHCEKTGMPIIVKTAGEEVYRG